MKIEIKKSEVFSEVEKQSAYLASTIEGGIHFDELWATVHEHEIMDSYWVEGCSSAVSLLMRYIRSESVEHNLEQHLNEEILSIKADMPDTFNDFLIGSIVSSIKMMLVNSILGSWLSVKYPGAAERYITLSKDFSDDVRSKLLYRNQPYQNRSKHEGDDLEHESVTEQFSKAGTDSANEPVKEVYEKGVADTANQKITEQFSTGGTDTDDKSVNDFFVESISDEKNQAATEQFSKGQIDVEEEAVTEYFEKVESDNLILKQYEKCCYHP